MRSYAEEELEGDWVVFARIAKFFVYKVPFDNREDFLHDLLLTMAKVKAKYQAQGRTLTEAGLMIVANYQIRTFWAKRRYRLFGLTCTHCTKEQQRECHTTKLPSECPKGKALRFLSLSNTEDDGDGSEPTEFGELIPDDKGIDLDAKLDARRILSALPKRLVQIGYKSYAGIPLEKEEKRYLKRWQKGHPSAILPRRDHLDERILEFLRKNPEGMTRRVLSNHVQTSVWELNWYLNQLIKRKQIIAVRRENSRGRPRSPLLAMAGAEIPGERMVKKERDERIRQAYFREGWSIKRIEREQHHDKRVIRRAVKKGAAGAV